jgi:hypothetical protein
MSATVSSKFPDWQKLKNCRVKMQSDDLVRRRVKKLPRQSRNTLVQSVLYSDKNLTTVSLFSSAEFGALYDDETSNRVVLSATFACFESLPSFGKLMRSARS